MDTRTAFLFLALAPLVMSGEPPDEKIGAPVDRGYFFYNFEYVPAPYTVTRKGLAVYINDKLVRPAPAKAVEIVVNEDPGKPGAKDELFGDPPKGKDPGDNFYHRKWLWLLKSMDAADARKEMFEMIKLAPNVDSVKWGGTDYFVVKLKNGESRNLGLEKPHRRREPLTPEQLTDEAEKLRQRYEAELNDGGFLSQSGFEHSMGRRGALEMMRVLLSEKTPDEQWAELEKRHLVRAANPEMRRYIQKFPDREGLLKKVNEEYASFKK